jgi:hypothetical protein
VYSEYSVCRWNATNGEEGVKSEQQTTRTAHDCLNCAKLCHREPSLAVIFAVVYRGIGRFRVESKMYATR